MLQKEREEFLKKIEECNKQMKPIEFVKTKKELEEKMEFFQDIGIEENKRIDEEKQINNLQIYFLDCFIEKIKMAETKKQITDLLYELRYYKQIPYKDITLSQIEKSKRKIENIETNLIKIACEQKILTTFSQEEKLNTKILANQFNSKIINLENTIYVLKYHKGILKIQIYDTNIEEETREIEITEKVELQVRLNKKIKVWE